MRIWLHTAILSILGVSLAGCNKPEPTPQPPAPEATPAPATQPQAAAMPRTAAPAGARVTLTSPVNGARVKSPVTVQFTIEGMSLAPAGAYEPGTGHHHVLIDTGLPPLDQPIPKDAQHVHFGQAQSEGQIELSPGEHTLQLLLGDGNHVPHDPPVMSELITITVE